MGVLIGMKRVDTLVDAFALVLSVRPDVGLLILGDGKARGALEIQARALGVEQQVTFVGQVDNPFPFLKRASVLVLASEYEGFSNAVIEAMFLDVPVITSYCSSDAREMCEQGAALGFDVGDAKQLSRQIVAVLGDGNLEAELGREEPARYRAPQALENSVPAYERLIALVAEGECRGMIHVVHCVAGGTTWPPSKVEFRLAVNRGTRC